MEQVKRLRQQKEWTQAELAFHAGMGPTAVNQIETGRREPSAGSLKKLANALGVSVGDPFEDSESLKAQAPLPFENDQRRGAKEATLEELTAASPLYSAYESQGRILASRWEEELREWTGKIPAGERPDLLDAGRLIQWTLDIGRDRSVYEAMATEAGLTRRVEMTDTLRLLEDTWHAALRMLERAVEPIKTDAKFLKIWEANDIDAILSNVESGQR